MNTTDKQFVCIRCVMDRSAPEIEFSETGCTFCDLAMKNRPAEKGFDYDLLKTDGKYDVLLGLSGGVDSSTCLMHLVENGIRLLCYSVDNGWNDPKADENIMRLVEGMRVPFFRYTLDLDVFAELQGAFLMSGTKNIEIPTDHVLFATSYELADEYGIKTIISGGNWATESIMPRSWGYQPRDLVHIKGVYKRLTGKKLEGLPTLSLFKFNYYKWIKGIEVINLLDYHEYNRQDSIKLLADRYGYKDYGEKHGESVFTRWFQNFYLFEKFGIDKRKAHLSSLTLSGQITRDEALIELQKNPVYPELGLEKRIFEYPRRDYTQFPNDEKLYEFISSVIRKTRHAIGK